MQQPIRDLDILDASDVALTGDACSCTGCGRRGLDGVDGLLCEYLSIHGGDVFCLARGGIISRLQIVVDHPVFRALARVAQRNPLHIFDEAVQDIPSIIARSAGIGVVPTGANSLNGLESAAEGDLWSRAIDAARAHTQRYHPDLAPGQLPGSTRRRRRIAAFLRCLSLTDLCALAGAVEFETHGLSSGSDADFFAQRLDVLESAIASVLRKKLLARYQHLAGSEKGWLPFAIRDVVAHCNPHCVENALDAAVGQREDDYGHVLALVLRNARDIDRLPNEPRPLPDIADQRFCEAETVHFDSFLATLVAWNRRPDKIRDVAITVWNVMENSHATYQRELERYRVDLSSVSLLEDGTGTSTP